MRVARPEPSVLGQVISRHYGRVFSVGWLMSMGLIFAAYVITDAASRTSVL